jgi:hypothetical protein
LKFLSQARKFLQHLAAEPPSKVQYFNVICASGHRMRGERTEGYQALRCPACGDGVFVLPRSPLPEPVAPTPAQSTKTAGGAGRWVPEGPVELSDASGVTLDVGGHDAPANGAEIAWEDVADEYTAPQETNREATGGETGEDRPGKPSRRRAAHARGAHPHDSGAQARRAPKPGGQGRPGASGSAGQFEPAARSSGGGRQATRSALPRIEQEQFGVVIRRRPMSRRQMLNLLILVGVPLLVVATVAWRAYQRRLQEYPLIAQEGLSKGIPALDEGNFDKAFDLLSKAKKAVNALGGAVERADEIRTAADEAEVFANLCSLSLEDLLDKANRPTPEDWKSHFDAVYKGQYFIFDTYIEAEPQPGTSSAYRLEYRVFPLGETSRIRRTDVTRPERIGRIDLTGFKLFELTHPPVGQRVTFGAKLASIEIDNDSDNEWLIRLEPNSGITITHTKALDVLGWPSASSADLPSEGQP